MYLSMNRLEKSLALPEIAAKYTKKNTREKKTRTGKKFCNAILLVLIEIFSVSISKVVRQLFNDIIYFVRPASHSHKPKVSNNGCEVNRIPAGKNESTNGSVEIFM